MHTLSLSGIHVTLPCAAAELLICIGGGRAPSPTWFTDLLSAMEKPGITSHILAIDKGVNLCRAVSKPPTLLIGDGDSASPEAWAWAVEHGAEVYRFPVEKDDSDTALSLRIAAQHFTRPLIILTAAFGGRLVHLFSTAAICAHAPVPCILIDEKEALLYLHGGESISIACDEMPRAISLLPFTEECAGVTTQGLHWELTGTVISARASTTISNIISPKNTARRFSIHLERGILGVYLCWQE
ncbi:thiamine diphosphokinase [uncultured Selenomonas sp.]|uniref:thiamine diphosphokinase n=1 Tax=uncultured Selenomonas sp. TaxID=159275 RepID=UPI00258F8EBA|nr:thiamine diphosphokinase [uncultured Selenomonas sp.]